jgi:hypothetical protein
MKRRRKPNNNIRQVRKITKLEYLLGHICLSDCNNSASASRTVMRFNIWEFLKNLYMKIKFLWNRSKISGILQKAYLQLS